MHRVSRQQRIHAGQFEFAEFESRRDRAAGQRVTCRIDAFRGKPLPGRHDHLEHGIRVRECVTQPMRRQSAGFVEDVNVERLAGIKMPDLVGPDPMPRRMGAIREQIVDRGRSRARLA